MGFKPVMFRRPCFLGVFYPTGSHILHPLPQCSLSSEVRELMEISCLGLCSKISHFLILNTTQCGSLCLLPSNAGGTVS